MRHVFKTVASFVGGDDVFLASDAAGILAWESPQAAVRWFKRFYTAAAQRDKNDAIRHYENVDFRLHQLSLEALNGGTFERAIVKNAADADKEFKPSDYEVVNVPGAHFAGILCQGKSAMPWHQRGKRPAFPERV